MGFATPPPGAAVVDYFDHNSAAYVTERHRWYDDIRQSVGPVFWSPHHGGYWVVIGFAEAERAAKDWETFSSKGVGSMPDRPQDAGIRFNGLFIPPKGVKPRRLLEEDPPAWELPRQILAPHFSVPAVARWRTRIQEIVDACIDRKIETGAIDFAMDLSNAVPAMFSMELVGLSLRLAPEVAAVHHLHAHLSADDPRYPQVLPRLEEEKRQIGLAVAARKADRRNDLISALLNAQDKGALLSDEEIAGLGFLIIGAGIDTTAAVLCTTFTILQQRPDLRRRLKENPQLTSPSFEEFMRIAAPTQGLSRTVTRDVELGGQKLRRGDRVMLCWAAANRDPREFANPHDVDLDRGRNLHLAFGAGVHRCIGSMFAKLEFEIVFNTVLRRMPDFVVDLEKTRSFENVGIVMGYTTVPATFTPGPKVGSSAKLPDMFEPA